MKVNNFRGFKEVFSFTLTQAIKTKANQVTFFIFLILMMAIPPLLSIVFGSKKEVTLDTITGVYFVNDSSYPDIDFTSIKEVEEYSHLNFISTKDSLENLKVIVDDEGNNSLLLYLSTQEDGSISLSSYTSLKDIRNSASFLSLKNIILQELYETKIGTFDLSDDINNFITSTPIVESKFVDILGNEAIEEDTTISNFSYWVIYGVLFILIMLCSLCSGLVANSVVTEKSTRVIEYLLINIHPSALLLGKVLAVVTFYILQLSIQLTGVFLSNKITKLIFKDINNPLSSLIPEDILGNVTLPNIVLIITLLLLGLILFSTIASICGATVSKIEELQEGMTLYTLVLLISAYTALGASNVMMVAGTNAFVTFSLLFPLSSPFLLPGAIIGSHIPWYIIVISLALQLVFILFIVNIAGKIYSTLILYNGNRIKFKDLKNIMKNS